jgi:hypothetical protein
MNAQTEVKAAQATAAIDRFPNYIFCADGSVISLVKKSPRKMKPIKMGAYVGLQLGRQDGAREKQYLHRLICEAFNGPPTKGQECRHLNGDKTDNRAANLIWGSKAENEADKVAHGTSPKGERNPCAKLTESTVRAMREHRERTKDSFAKIAVEYGVSTMTAYRAVIGQSWENV